MKFLDVFIFGVIAIIVLQVYRSGGFSNPAVIVPSVPNPAGQPKNSVPNFAGLLGFLNPITGSNLNTPTTGTNMPWPTDFSQEALLKAVAGGDGIVNPAGTYGDLTGIGTVANNDLGFLIGD